MCSLTLLVTQCTWRLMVLQQYHWTAMENISFNAVLCCSLQKKGSVGIRAVELYRNCVMLLTKFGLRQHQKCTHSEEKSCKGLEKPASFHPPSPTSFLSLLCYCADLPFSSSFYRDGHHMALLKWGEVKLDLFRIIFGKQIIRHSFQTNTFPTPSIQKLCTKSQKIMTLEREI